MRIKKLVYGTMKPSKIGGGFMNQYNIMVQQLLAYLTKRKQCSSSRLSHKQCYEEFGQYLEENNLYLSQEAADQWIARFPCPNSFYSVIDLRNNIQVLRK